MHIYRYSHLRIGQLMSTRTLIIFLGISSLGLGPNNRDQTFQPDSLSTIRELVVRNESLASLIKMEYTARSEEMGDVPEDFLQVDEGNSGRKVTGKRFTITRSVWAQDGIRIHSTNSDYWGEEIAKSDVLVIDGEVVKWGRLPDLMQGGIGPIESIRWTRIDPVRLGLRPFENEYRLSDILVPKYASIYDTSEMIDGRTTVVIDVQRPSIPVYFARIWMDVERGMPLRIEHYDHGQDSDKPTLMGSVNSIKLHQLPNGGWITVSGTKTVYFTEEDGSTWMGMEHIQVDPNSVTIRREDIPDSLFTLTFPEGATIVNRITGVTTKGRRVWDPKLESIIEESIEALDISDTAPGIMSSSEQTNQQEAKDSLKIPQKQPVNKPTLSENENTTGALADVKPATFRGHSIVWILLPAFLAAFALTIIFLIFRSPSRNAVRRNAK